MARMSEFTFLSSDGQTALSAREYLPEGDSVGIVQIVHGIAEHIGRYDHFARFMSDHGYLVCAEDHLGHGNTPENAEDLGYTADKDGWVKMTDNVRALHERIAPQYPGIPYFILGHSMGSFLTRSYLIRYPGTVDACALLGTGQQPESVLKAGLAACRLEQIRLGKRGRSKLLQSLCFGAYNSQFKPNRTESDWVCSVDEVVDAYIADPFCQVMPTVTLMRDMLTGIRFNQQAENLAKMDKTTPVFFLSGDQDPVGSNGKGVRAAYQSFLDAGCGHVRLKLYPGGRHEMLNEHNWQDVYDELLSWFDQQIK